MFQAALFQVLVMAAYAVPGFLLVKTKLVGESNISAFAKVLLFVCQPALSLYSFNKADFTPALFKQMAAFFGLSIALQLAVILILFAIFSKKEERYRILMLSCVLGNVGYLGVPLLEAVLPEYPQAIVLSATYSVGMNLISWTIGCFVISGDKKYISVKKMLLNPQMIALVVALPLFFCKVKYPQLIGDGVAILGRMSTPLCMIILGMRLAVAPKRELLTTGTVYLSSVIKLVILPLAAFVTCWFLPLPYFVRATFFILSCCPTASVVLNLAEMFGNGQKYAAYSVLMSTILCIATIPLMTLLIM